MASALPKLLRLQDASTGRTIAYLQPDEKERCGQEWSATWSASSARRTFDESLRLNIITPSRMDVLTPDGVRQATASQKPDADTTPEKPATTSSPSTLRPIRKSDSEPSLIAQANHDEPS
jgi:hypothetical protein